MNKCIITEVRLLKNVQHSDERKRLLKMLVHRDINNYLGN